MSYARHISPHKTPQSEPIPGSTQVANSAGGYSFPVDKWVRFQRFLILGAEGGTYYIGERKLVQENAKAALECLAEDGARAVKMIVEISQAGRAPKNDPALFALALAITRGNDKTKAAAATALPLVARTGTHLFQFVREAMALRSFGSALKRAVAGWYKRPADQVAFQMVKYASRHNLTHDAVITLAHPDTPSAAHVGLFAWAMSGRPEPMRLVKDGDKWGREVGSVTKGWQGWKLNQDTFAVARGGLDPEAITHRLPAKGLAHGRPVLPEIVEAFLEAKAATSPSALARLVRERKLPREVVEQVNSAWLNETVIWEALFEHMPPTAMIRNLPKMTALGMLKPLGAMTKTVVERLADGERLRKARVHPMHVLSALRVYAAGRSAEVSAKRVMVGREALTWEPAPQIVEALDEAVYLTVAQVEPTGLRRVIACDVSGSMDSPVSGMPGITNREATGMMALIVARREPQHVIVGFSTRGWQKAGVTSRWGGQYNPGIETLDISPKWRLDKVCEYMRRLPMSGTDCALPMVWATEKGIEADSFEILTDSETWAGVIHPPQALQAYRRKVGRQNVKLAVLAFASNNFTIADPADALQMDFGGLDSAVPRLLVDFLTDGRAAVAQDDEPE